MDWGYQAASTPSLSAAVAMGRSFDAANRG